MSRACAETQEPVARHRCTSGSATLGAKFAPFGGWSMPLEYAGAGVLAEHAAVRTAVGIFDVSHLGKIAVSGRAPRTS